MFKNNEKMLHEIKKDKIKYYYTGPVYKFDNIYREKWSGNTYAVSEKQALNQLIYQFKKEDGWVVDTAFHLDPKYLTSDNLDMKPQKVNSTKPQVAIKYCPNCGTRLTDGGYCPVCDDGDEEALDEDIKMLDITTPYMLRRDGRLIKCGETHPYIKMSQADSDETNLKTLESHPEFLYWFEQYCIDDSTAQLINEFENIDDINEKYELMNLLNDLTNQEFCRVRTSNYKDKFGGDNGEIYFRISSNGFNWFDLIWNVVNNYQNQIKNVTVINDKQSKGGKEFDYYYDHIPVNDFLTLKGDINLENCNNIYYNNIEEELSMENKKELTEDIFADEEETEKDKEFDEKFGKYANVPLSFDDFNKLMQEMIDFYDSEDDLDTNLTEDISSKLKLLLKKYPDAYIPKYDKVSGLPILPKSEYGDWEY